MPLVPLLDVPLYLAHRAVPLARGVLEGKLTSR